MGHNLHLFNLYDRVEESQLAIPQVIQYGLRVTTLPETLQNDRNLIISREFGERFRVSYLKVCSL